MKKVTIVLAGAVLVFGACSKMGMVAPTGSTITSTKTTAQSTGIRSVIPAYYDSVLHRIIFVEFSSMAEASLIAHNNSINFIYQSDAGLPGGQPFISVIDAIPGDGFNPIWREVQITFNPGITPRQLFSDNQVLALAYGPNPQITLDTTNEVYWCPVVGAK